MILYFRCCVDGDFYCRYYCSYDYKVFVFFFVMGWDWEICFDEMSVNYGLAITVS